MEIVTKAKKSCVAFEKPSPRKAGRGRPPKKGPAVHLKELFLSHKENFQEAEIGLYSRKKFIRYYCTDLLWGQGLYQELRFVLVEMDGGPEHPGQHQPGTGAVVHHQALQLQVPDRMYFPGAETADRGILLPILVKAYAKTEPLPEKRGTHST